MTFGAGCKGPQHGTALSCVRDAATEQVSLLQWQSQEGALQGSVIDPSFMPKNPVPRGTLELTTIRLVTGEREG